MSFNYKACFVGLKKFAAEIELGATEVLDTVGSQTALYASTLVNRRKTSKSLKDSVVWRPTSMVSGKVVAAKPYARFVEYGRGPVRAKNGKMLRFVINGQVFFRKSVGPAAARPFMQPARDRAEVTARLSAESMVMVAMKKVGA